MMQKKLNFRLFPLAVYLILIHSLLNAENCFAQFQPDVRLTNDAFPSSTSYNNARCVAANGSTVHVVWHDARNTVNNYEIYYKRSTDGGTTWGADTRLTNTNNSSSELACITVSGSAVHIVWLDYRDGNGEIYYKRSTDGGVNWEADVRLTNNSSDSQSPSLTVTGQVLHTVWYDNRDGNYEIYYKRSTDGGLTWSADTRMTNNSGQSWYPCVSVSGTYVHVVWYDGRDGNDEIYYKSSTDAGVSWGTDTRLTNSAGLSQRPSVAATGNIVQVLWWDFRDFNPEIYHKRSTDGGVNWTADTRLTNNAGDSYNPCVAVSGSFVHFVWYDNKDGNNEIYYKMSTDDGASWGADIRLTNNSPGVSYLPSIAVSGQALHVVWSDNRDANYEIYYKRDPNGNPVGITNINSEVPDKYSLLQNYPNPFNPVTSIEFTLPRAGYTELIVFNSLGEMAAFLFGQNLSPGSYKVNFEAGTLPSGVYFYRLKAGNVSITKKFILLK